MKKDSEKSDETWQQLRHRLRVFENRVLRRDEETGGWRGLHNEELRDLYSSSSVIRMAKSRRMRWALNVARMGEKRYVSALGSNSIRGTDVYLRLFCVCAVLCVGSG
jgi:hypothetical protein